MISLRAQLRLSYETYAWLRYLTWAGLLLLAVLLLIVSGGFPPSSFLLFWQMLPLTGRLLSLHGPAALLSLAALAIQALTWFLLWGLLILLCNALARYTWRLYRSQSLLASAWQPSTSLAFGKPAPVTLAQTAPLAPPFVPGRPAPRKPAPVAQPAAPLVRPAPDASASAATRQFAQPTMPLTRPRATQTSGDFSSGWSSSSGSSGPGVAWDTGITRKGRPNEDSVLTLRGTCNFAERLLPFELHIVADGMGGHSHGSLASHLAIRSMLETVIPGLVASPATGSEQIVDILIDGVHWANQVIYQHGK